jgi:hypothetical protein
MIVAFLSGISFMTFCASGIYFLKFWRSSRDNLFLYFCIACWLLAIERIALPLVLDEESFFSNPEFEASVWIYLLRLIAFFYIFFGVISKNRNTGNRF